MNREYQEKVIMASIEAVYVASTALDAVTAHEGYTDGSVHMAMAAARSCILMAVALAGVRAPGVGDWEAHAKTARSMLDASERAARARRESR